MVGGWQAKGVSQGCAKGARGGLNLGITVDVVDHRHAVLQ